MATSLDKLERNFGRPSWSIMMWFSKNLKWRFRLIYLISIMHVFSLLTGYRWGRYYVEFFVDFSAIFESWIILWQGWYCIDTHSQLEVSTVTISEIMFVCFSHHFMFSCKLGIEFIEKEFELWNVPVDDCACQRQNAAGLKKNSRAAYLAENWFSNLS